MARTFSTSLAPLSSQRLCTFILACQVSSCLRELDILQHGMLQHLFKAPAPQESDRSQGRTRQRRLSLVPSLSAGAFKTMTLPGPDPTETTRLQLVNEAWGIVAHLSAMTVAHGDMGEPWGQSLPALGFATGRHAFAQLLHCSVTLVPPVHCTEILPPLPAPASPQWCLLSACHIGQGA